jgi:hypothetical protein
MGVLHLPDADESTILFDFHDLTGRGGRVGLLGLAVAV